MSEVRRYVPRILRDDGMIEAQEVAHYTHLNLSQYVLASDYDALAARVQELERDELKEKAYRYAHWTPEHTIEEWLADRQRIVEAKQVEADAALRQQLAEAQATVARQQEQLRLCNIDQLHAEQQVARLRESMEKIKDTATHGHGSALDVFGWLIMIRDEATIALRERGA